MAENHLENEISWEIPESDYSYKDVSWYWLGLIGTIILLAFAVWQKNFLFAVFVIIAYFIMNYLGGRFPTIWQIKISKKGILISLPNGEAKKFYPLDSMESFDIFSPIGAVDLSDTSEEEYKELIIKFKSKFSPYLKINIYPKEEEKIKNFLLQFIPREEYSPSLVDAIGKMVGF